MFAASKTATSGSAPDAQFNYVTMLLHGDGTNGAQNNTFVDGSSNNFTITRNGNTTQGSFSPYGSNWSVAASSATSNYLTVNSTVALGSSDYTVEFWFAGNNFELSWGTTGGYSPIIINSSGDLYFGNSTNSGFSGTAPAISGFIIKDGSWNHYAIVRQSGTGKVFRNGTQIATPTLPSSNATNGNVVIGLYDSGMGGYVSNFRAVVGTAVYTSAFTPSTTPLTAITNTKLLTCQSNRFVDNSTNAYTITPSGSPSVQRFNPFGTSTEYSTSVIGGSGYYDGAGDYLTATKPTFIAGNHTVSAYIYLTTTPSTNRFILSVSDGSGYTKKYAIVITSSLQLRVDGHYTASTPSGQTFTGGAITLNSWNYIQVTRSGNVFTGYINGSSVGTFTLAWEDPNTTTITIGSIATSESTDDQYRWTGYISNLRITNTAESATVPTSPVTAISGTQFLLNGTNGAIFDNAMMNDLETVGNAQISTSVKKFGTGAIALDGSGDYLVEPTSTNFGYGTGDFTIEFWVYLNGTGDQTLVSNLSSASSINPHIYYSTFGSLRYYTNSSDRITGSSLSTSTWYHIAICRASGSTKMFINGTQSGSTYTDSNDYGASAPIGVGTYWSSGSPVTTSTLNGYIDDLRITKGYARYTSNFTAPIAAFSNTGP